MSKDRTVYIRYFHSRTSRIYFCKFGPDRHLHLRAGLHGSKLIDLFMPRIAEGAGVKLFYASAGSARTEDLFSVSLDFIERLVMLT